MIKFSTVTKLTPPYNNEAINWLNKNPGKSIRVVSGVDGATWCDCMYDYDLMEIEQAFLNRKIDYPANLILLPGNDSWRDYWWPLNGVAVMIDWPERSLDEAHDFANFLLYVVKAKSVYMVNPDNGEYLSVENKKAKAA